jgi:hypothetical protein
MALDLRSDFNYILWIMFQPRVPGGTLIRRQVSPGLFHGMIIEMYWAYSERF